MMQGKFRPQNPKKYKGDPSNIIYRSSWEFKLMRILDSHKDIIQWSSEEIIIPYRSPIDGKIHRYFPDFWVKKKNKDGTVEVWIIEVKPASQTKEPIPRKKINKSYIKEVYDWGVNSAKWDAAREYCADKGYVFKIFTEKELGIKQ